MTVQARHTSECGCIFHMCCPLHRAAPDLLAACKTALPELEFDARHDPTARPGVKQLKAAIAVAEGKE